MIEEILSVRGWKLLLGIISINLLVVLMSQVALINETVFFNTYSEQLTYDRALDLFQKMRSFSWMTYIFIPVLLVLKFTAISILIYIGLFFSDLHKEVTLGRVFRIVVAAEMVFVLASIIKMLWFMFFAGNYTLEDISFFYPLSLINIFHREEVATFWIYPLQTVNIFQITYIFLLSLGLSKTVSIRRQLADRVVLTTYVPAITVWVAVIMFITIDTMP